MIITPASRGSNFYLRLVCLCILTGALAGSSEIYPTAERFAKIKLSNLLLTAQDLPLGWSQDGAPRPPTSDSPTTDGIGVDFNSPSIDYGLAQGIMRFKDVGEAQAYYSDPVGVYGFGSIPPNWNFRSYFLDSHKISCYTYSNSPYPDCDWIGRYSTIVIEVVAQLNPKYLTLSDLKNIIQKIDTKLIKLFHASKAQP